MKRISRAQMRKKPLDTDCLKAYAACHEYGSYDPRSYCHGLNRDMTDWDIQEKCKTCGAYVQNEVPLRIASAAVKMKIDGVNGTKIIPLHRHGDINRILVAFGYKPRKGYRIIEQGFVDNLGFFYSREDAANVVKRNGQALKNDDVGKELFSEDLY